MYANNSAPTLLTSCLLFREWAPFWVPGATCTKLFSGHLRQYQDLRDDATKFCIHKANLRQKT